MKVNIYYGGRGLIEDPTIFVINKLTEVLEELRVEVNRYNIFEEKNAITTLPLTLKETNGIILAASVEWYGIGGYMQQFLDMCWLYADKEQLANLYMMPIVMATTYGEKEAELTLIQAWEMLGGIPITGLAAYVENMGEFEHDSEYKKIIEKRAENFYRSIHQRAKALPTSNLAVKANILKTRTIELTPQESEQLSKFVSDEGYVKKQKEDIEELSAMFKKLLNEDEEEEIVSETQQDVPKDAIIEAFYKSFSPEPGFGATYVIMISDTNKILRIVVNEDQMECFYDTKEHADVVMRLQAKMLKAIIHGKTTFQKGFMSGEITAKGNFKTLRTLDQIFSFRK